MTTIEEKLQTMLGQQAFTIASLMTQLEQAQTQVKELEAKYVSE